MTKSTLLTAAAAISLLAGGAALAQTAAPATPAAPKPTAQPAAPPTAATPPAATPPAATPAPATTPAAPAAVVAKGDIVDTLKASGQFTVLLRTLDETNLTTLIKTNKNLTLFAPTDAAFAALPAGELKRLEENPQELQKLLTYHLINAPIDSTKVKENAGKVATVAGPEIVLDNSGAAFTVGPATVTQADVRATNGLIHVVDKVLTPTGTPVAANMTTDMPQGRVIRASWQQPAATDQPTDAGMTPATAPPADPADPNATDPMTGAPADPAAPAEPATAAPVAVPTEPGMAPATAVAAAAAEPAQVTNGPVLDTAENRAKYPPQSRAGKRTAAKGN
ncbi:fasciclin domain-containing protein [Caulobacter sp. NIBR1757]|uniref:fasciclin domain-containing protein n=1 Tax=Caulobacter sp. NIBR1757 TaxID=3016000 RepID=UPI0022F00A02|nr:fasciclin domain-containing protein [Caulobacter sp. NIBR1757]WGM40092.1 hypothetical protein AMEJIAPC_03033 [Caulobacter sp. NIBR1757]